MGILVGFVAVAILTGIRLALAPIAGPDMALIFYVLAVLLAAGAGGVTGGLTTTVLSLAAGIVFVIGPESFWRSWTEWLRAATFGVEGVAISLTVEQLRRRTEALSRTARELADERRLIERMALEDPVTGLGNRRAFDSDLNRSLAQSSREETALTVAMADIDGLKLVNDEQGHVRGDALLVAVAAVMRNACRASDRVYRFGGDEFAFLLTETSREDCEVLQTRLRSLCAAAGAPFGCAGVSIGAALSPEDGRDAIALVRLADSRMYDAKAGSRRADGRTAVAQR